MSASLCRAISTALAVSASFSRLKASPIWSAARLSSRVSSGSGNPSRRARVAQIEPERLLVGRDLHPEQLRFRIRRSVRPAVLGLVRPDPARRHVPRRSGEEGVDPGSGWRIRSRIGDDHLAAGDLAAEPDPAQPRLPGQPLQDRGQRVGDVRGCRQCPADPEQRLRLARPAGGVLGPVRLERSQPADHDRHEQQQEEVEPFLGILDGEREARLDEQRVVEKERDERRQHRRPRAEQHGDADDGDEVDGRRVRNGQRGTLDEGNREGRNREERDGPGNSADAHRLAATFAPPGSQAGRDCGQLHQPMLPALDIVGRDWLSSPNER